VPNGITAGSTSSINVGTSGAVVALDTNGVTSSQINLGSNVSILAS
jgi:hypothetical protein